MKASTPATGIALDNRDQTIRHRVTITCPVIGNVVLAVSAFKVDGDTVSDTAAGTRLEDGYTAYGAEFTASGRVDGYDDETKTAAWLFARYPFPAGDGTLTPLAYVDVLQSPVSIETGIVADDGTTQWFEQFYGTVDDYAQTSDGEVQFTCIDLRSLLRNTVELPGVVTAPPFNAGLTAEFAIDRLLRAGTKGLISSWPAQRPSCVLAVGMRTSVWPDVGTLLTDTSAVAPAFAPGLWGSALSDLGRFRTLAYQLATRLQPTDSPYFEFTATQQANVFLQLTDTNPNIYTNVAYFVTFQPGSVVVSSNSTGGGDSFSVTVPTDTQPHTVSVNVTQAPGSTTWTAQVNYDGQITNSGNRTAPAARSTTALLTYVSLSINGGAGRVEALQITSESAPASTYPFTPRAVIDPSKNTLQVIPPISGDPWQTIQQIALAELGVAGFFGTRTFRFLNRDSVVARPIVRTVTSAGALEAVGVRSESASVVNRARVGYTAWTFATAVSTVYTADSVIKVPRGGTASIVVNLDQYAVSVDTTAALLPDGTTTATASWYRAAVDQAGTKKHPGGVSFTFAQPAPDKIIVTARNTSTADAYLVSSAEYLDLPVGTPVFRIAGRAVTPSDEVTIDYQWPTPELGGAASTPRFGEVAAEPVSGNPWIQTADGATALVKYIVLENYQPRADLTDVAINPDPRLEPCDALHLVDPVRTGVDDYVRLFGVSVTYEAENTDGTTTYEMTINARAFGPPGAWLLGIDGRSELGVTTYLR